LKGKIHFVEYFGSNIDNNSCASWAERKRANVYEGREVIHMELTFPRAFLANQKAVNKSNAQANQSR